MTTPQVNKPNAGESGASTDATQTTQTLPVVTPPAAPETKVASLANVERIPSNWTILPDDQQEAHVVATCTVSGREFKGSIADFNSFLKS